MNTLYAFPFACSLAVHMVLRRDEVPFTLSWVERGPARKVAGDAYAAVNPKRKVPALRLPDGELLTEVVAILHHLEAPTDPVRRRRLLEWLCFLSTELHQTALGPLFDPSTPSEANEDVRTRLLGPVVDHLERSLSRGTLLGDDAPSVADAYAVWGLMLLHGATPELVDRPALTRFRTSMLELPWVREAVRAERKGMTGNRKAS